MPKAKQTAEWNKGYRAAKTQALAKVGNIVARIERDINNRSGLSPMVWHDRHAHEKLIEEWRILVTEELARL